MSNSVDNWQDDLLDRKQYADFLTAYLQRKCVPGQPGIVLALDAPWGLGKSFFMERWAKDLTDSGQAVVTFNAWENDSSDAPVVAFMGELRNSLRPLYDQLPKAAEIRKGLEAKARETLTNLRKATLPTLGVISKAVLKKTTGVALDEVMDAFSGTGDAEAIVDAAAEAAPDALEKGLDEFFDKALQGHTERMESVKAFRRSLEELLGSLHANQLAKGPLYVFIDELDRCRPDYAIRLLEGIKHLFSVRGVAFVISTNLDQLGNAVGAVYGPAFDGFRYLKRFFDFEYELPQPTRAAFVRSQMAGTSLQGLQDPSGLDTRGSSAYDPAAAFGTVAEAMRLDLRSLQRVIAIADAAVSGAPKDTPFVAIWLFFLAALRHVRPDSFLKVATRSMDRAEFVRMAQALCAGPLQVAAIQVSDQGRYSDSETSLLSVLAVLYEITGKTQRDLANEIRNEDGAEIAYPALLRHVLMDTWRLRGSRSNPLAEHASLIAAAGHMRKQSPNK